MSAPNFQNVSGRNQLLILGKNGISGDYQPGTNATPGIYGRPDLRGTIDVASTTINFQDFNTNCSINIQGIHDFTFQAPSGASATLTLDSPSAGQQEVHGTVSGGLDFVPLTLANATNLVVTGSSDGANDITVNDSSLSHVTIHGGSSGDKVTVMDTAASGSLYFDGSYGEDMLEVYGDGTGSHVKMANGSLVGLTAAPLTWKTTAPAVEDFILHNAYHTIVLDNAQIAGSQLAVVGGTLQGSGTVPALQVGGDVRPGTPQFLGFGVLTTGDLNLRVGTLFSEIDGTTAGTNYDQVKVTGAVKTRRRRLPECAPQ
jgi:hypothetical protein